MKVINLCLLLILIFPLFGCSSLDKSEIPMEIISVENPIYTEATSSKGFDSFEKACINWQLTKQAIKYFFDYSDQYEYSPYIEYYQVPCEIRGTLKNNGKIWNFQINGGGIAAVWINKEKKYFGCKSQKCKKLVLIDTDLMQGL